MKILHSLLDIPTLKDVYPEIGLTIGNFDGVHLGHRELLKKIKQTCVEKNLQFVVVTFVPHPQKILQPERERFLINSYEHRRSLLQGLGVDYLIEMTFTRDFSTLQADEFLSKYLLIYPRLKDFYLGYDFAFGANKQGTYDLVKTVCAPLNVQVEIQPKYEFNGKVVSSSPNKGVYITRTKYNGMIYKSITNIGNNPTFKDTDHVHIETNLFDFDTDIYGENLDIEFLHKIRDEKKFSTVNDLIAQIKADVNLAKEFLSKR